LPIYRSEDILVRQGHHDQSTARRSNGNAEWMVRVPAGGCLQWL
jgi:hypothetical protein